MRAASPAALPPASAVDAIRTPASTSRRGAACQGVDAAAAVFRTSLGFAEFRAEDAAAGGVPVGLPPVRGSSLDGFRVPDAAREGGCAPEDTGVCCAPDPPPPPGGETRGVAGGFPVSTADGPGASAEEGNGCAGGVTLGVASRRDGSIPGIRSPTCCPSARSWSSKLVTN
ncbi:hypothetical protein IU429_29430 [Nocardia elegans]|uniref:hypothetical protein n=1 Tax=Nocardia elegans TaxID=300029 RepID=UPI0018949992|nr:hypothetical protein [Nocardia elegans]MBF6451790.1 hypothetical protein [Nocardia elegans]